MLPVPPLGHLVLDGIPRRAWSEVRCVTNEETKPELPPSGSVGGGRKPGGAGLWR